MHGYSQNSQKTVAYPYWVPYFLDVSDKFMRGATQKKAKTKKKKKGREASSLHYPTAVDASQESAVWDPPEKRENWQVLRAWLVSLGHGNSLNKPWTGRMNLLSPTDSSRPFSLLVPIRYLHSRTLFCPEVHPQHYGTNRCRISTLSLPKHWRKPSRT